MRYFIRLASAACSAALMAVVLTTGVRADIVGSRHDMTQLATDEGWTISTDRVCVFCHTPHNFNAAAAPLWNRDAPVTGAWTMYTSSTMSQVLPGTPEGVSLACLSCHDGATALDAGTGESLTLTPGGAQATMGDILGTVADVGAGGDLADDHPISVDYATTLGAKSGEFVTIANLNVPLYNGNVECASCHDPHQTANVPFLRTTTAASALCVECHIK